VRKPFEANIVRLDHDLLRPHTEVVAGDHSGVPRVRDVLVICRMGERSGQAARALVDAGYPRVFNLDGGLTAWATDVDPTLPTC